MTGCTNIGNNSVEFSCTSSKSYNSTGCTGTILENLTNTDCGEANGYLLLECPTTPILSVQVFNASDCKNNISPDAPYTYYTTGRCMSLDGSVYAKFALSGSTVTEFVHSTEYCNDTTPLNATYTLDTCSNVTGTAFFTKVHSGFISPAGGRGLGAHVDARLARGRGGGGPRRVHRRLI